MSKITEDTNDGTIIADVLSGRTEQFSIIVRRYQHALMRVGKSQQFPPNLISAHFGDGSIEYA